MTRSNPNWFAAGCGLVYIQIFLFMPFYSLFIHLNGMTLLSLSPVCALLLLAGIIMILSALLLDLRISIGVGCVSLIMTLCFAMMGNAVLSSNALVSLAGSLLADTSYSGITSLIYVPMGIGSILCLGMCIVFIVLEILLRPRAPRIIREDDFDSGNSFTDF